ncbi:MAG: hypothetical protein CME61_09520 [Halobacteriovoraceae bacterium]|nr:hypothetical protein [Halobacteriovoraceae bacterium]
MLKVNHYSNVIPSLKNLSPIVYNLSRSLNQHVNKSKIFSTINSDSFSDVNFYHFGGIWSYLNFIKYKNKTVLNVPVFHGTDLHGFSKDLSIVNKLKVKVNFLFNLRLMKKSDFFFIVSNSLLKHVPNRYKHKAYVINLGVDLMPINNVKSLNIIKKKKVVAFVNNNSREIKNSKLAYDYCLKNNLILKELKSLKYDDFLKKLAECQFLLITSFAEGSPNVLKESILLGVKPITVSVGDCNQIVNRFGGKIIDFNGNLVKECTSNKKYSLEDYISMKKANNILIDIIKINLNLKNG